MWHANARFLGLAHASCDRTARLQLIGGWVTLTSWLGYFNNRYTVANVAISVKSFRNKENGTVMIYRKLVYDWPHWTVNCGLSHL